MDLVPAKFRQRLIDRLAQKIRDNGMALTTGFVGTPVLCRVLSDNGHSDIAYQLFMREKFPSWLYEVNLGATTVWERWNSVLEDGTISGTDMNSMNHYAYGSIVEWMYRNVCGLRPVESAPGFRKVEIKPDTPQTLTYANARFNSPVGEYRVGWKRSGKTLEFHIVVPFGATAHATLPDAPKTIKLNGKNMASAGLKLPAGEYKISYIPAAPKPAPKAR